VKEVEDKEGKRVGYEEVDANGKEGEGSDGGLEGDEG
jgi:hypothetical protein